MTRRGHDVENLLATSVRLRSGGATALLERQICFATDRYIIDMAKRKTVVQDHIEEPLYL